MNLIDHQLQKNEAIGTKIFSIRGAIQSSNAAHNLNPQYMNRLQNIEEAQVDGLKERKKRSSEQSEASKKKVIKYKLNVETDSEDENEIENQLEQLAKKDKDGISTSPIISPAKQKQELYENQKTLGAEQTKAKINANFLLGVGDKNLFMNSQKSLLKKGDKSSKNQQYGAGVQLSLGQASTLGFNPQATLNQGSSLSIKVGDAKMGNLNQAINKLQTQSSQQNNVSNSNINNNSYIVDENDEDITFLKGLSQNQQLGENCDLKEYIENDSMIISIKTSDFFTFIRLQDEVDEIKRKHMEFLQHKQRIDKEIQKQSVIKSNTNLKQALQQPNMIIDTNLSSAARQYQRNGFQMEQINKMQGKQNYQYPEKMSNKSVGQDIYAIFSAKKFGMKLKDKVKENQKLRKHFHDQEQYKIHKMEIQNKTIDSNQQYESLYSPSDKEDEDHFIEMNNKKI